MKHPFVKGGSSFPVGGQDTSETPYLVVPSNDRLRFGGQDKKEPRPVPLTKQGSFSFRPWEGSGFDTVLPISLSITFCCGSAPGATVKAKDGSPITQRAGGFRAGRRRSG